MDVVTEADIDNVLEIKVDMALDSDGEERTVVSIDSNWKVCGNVGDGSTSTLVLYALDRLESVLLEGEISVTSLGTVAIVVQKNTGVGTRLLVSSS